MCVSSHTSLYFEITQFCAVILLPYRELLRYRGMVFEFLRKFSRKQFVWVIYVGHGSCRIILPLRQIVLALEMLTVR